MYLRKATFLCIFLFGCLCLQSGNATEERTSHIEVTGEARVPATLTPVRAELLARDMAQRDARRQILLSAYGKPLPQGARLVGELRNVTFSQPERFERDGRQMIRVVARVATADIGEVRVVVDDRADVRLDDIVAGPLENHPPLLGGGAHIFWIEDSWLCIGVGFAPTEQGATAARRAAEADADARITETIFGVAVDFRETSIESLVDMSGFAALRQEIRRITRQEAEGALRHVQTAGSWYTAGREMVAVVRVVGIPTVQLAGLDEDAKPIQVRDLDMEEDWRAVLRHYPMLLSGGATLVEKDEAVYLVAVGSAPAHPPQAAITIAKSDARRAATRFLNGFTTRMTDEVREELIIVERNLNEEVLRDVEESVRRIRQQAGGVIPGLASIGRWRSLDDTRVFIAFAAKL